MTQRYIDLAFDDTSPRSFGGFDNENEATVIRLKVLDPDAKYYIEIEQACGKHDKYCSDALPVADGYAVFEVPRDFTHETLYVQGVMKVDGMCRKTARVRVGFSRSINALDELPENHPSWADSVDERIDGLEMGMKDAVTYTPQTLTEEQQAQARKNITVTKSYQIPTRVSGNDLLVDGWAAAFGGFDIVASDIEHGALPYFVADGCIFLCTGIHHSARDSITFVSGTVDYSALAKIVYKNAYWESGTSTIDIQTMEVSQHDIEERAQTAYFYVGEYGYIYGQHYEELAGDNPKYDIPKKYPYAVVDGKFKNAVLPLFGIYEELKQIVYARTDATPDGNFKIQGLIVGDMTTPFQVIDIDIPVYIKPADGIPKFDLEQSVQTSLDKADTAISLGLTAATPGQIIKVKTVQDGKPTEWEAAWQKWEKIAAITLTDAAAAITQNFGREYAEIIIVDTVPVVAEGAALGIKADGEDVFYGDKYIASTGPYARQRVYHMYPIDGYLLTDADPAGATINKKNSSITQRQSAIYSKDTIGSLYYYVRSTDVLLPSGTKLEIYGVRA